MKQIILLCLIISCTVTAFSQEADIHQQFEEQLRAIINEAMAEASYEDNQMVEETIKNLSIQLSAEQKKLLMEDKNFAAQIKALIKSAIAIHQGKKPEGFDGKLYEAIYKKSYQMLIENGLDEHSAKFSADIQAQMLLSIAKSQFDEKTIKAIMAGEQELNIDFMDVIINDIGQEESEQPNVEATLPESEYLLTGIALTTLGWLSNNKLAFWLGMLVLTDWFFMGS